MIKDNKITSWPGDASQNNISPSQHLKTDDLVTLHSLSSPLSAPVSALLRTPLTGMSSSAAVWSYTSQSTSGPYCAAVCTGLWNDMTKNHAGVFTTHTLSVTALGKSAVHFKLGTLSIRHHSKLTWASHFASQWGGVVEGVALKLQRKMRRSRWFGMISIRY